MCLWVLQYFDATIYMDKIPNQFIRQNPPKQPFLFLLFKSHMYNFTKKLQKDYESREG